MYLETANWQSRGGLLGAYRHLAVSGWIINSLYYRNVTVKMTSLDNCTVHVETSRGISFNGYFKVVCPSLYSLQFWTLPPPRSRTVPSRSRRSRGRRISSSSSPPASSRCPGGAGCRTAMVVGPSTASPVVTSCRLKRGTSSILCVWFIGMWSLTDNFEPHGDRREVHWLFFVCDLYVCALV